MRAVGSPWCDAGQDLMSAPQPPFAASNGSAALPRLFDGRRLLPISGGVIVGLIIGLTFGLLAFLRSIESDDAEKELSNLSAVLAEQTARTFQSVELIVDAIEERVKVVDVNRLDVPAMHAMLREK